MMRGKAAPEIAPKAGLSFVVFGAFIFTLLKGLENTLCLRLRLGNLTVSLGASDRCGVATIQPQPDLGPWRVCALADKRRQKAQMSHFTHHIICPSAGEVRLQVLLTISWMGALPMPWIRLLAKECATLFADISNSY
jgi:hypothetical protein